MRPEPPSEVVNAPKPRERQAEQTCVTNKYKHDNVTDTYGLFCSESEGVQWWLIPPCQVKFCQILEKILCLSWFPAGLTGLQVS